MRAALAAVALGHISSLVNAELEPWLDPSLPASERAKALVSEMTLEEKCLQLTTCGDIAAPRIDRLGVPSYDWRSNVLHGQAQAVDILCPSVSSPPWNSLTTALPALILAGRSRRQRRQHTVCPGNWFRKCVGCEPRSSGRRGEEPSTLVHKKNPQSTNYLNDQPIFLMVKVFTRLAPLCHPSLVFSLLFLVFCSGSQDHGARTTGEAQHEHVLRRKQRQRDELRADPLGA